MRNVVQSILGATKQQVKIRLQSASMDDTPRTRRERYARTLPILVAWFATEWHPAKRRRRGAMSEKPRLIREKIELTL
jgi:hypothetical protein